MKQQSTNIQTPNKKSTHILNASSNLLGICFILLSSIKVLGKADCTVIDEVCAVAIILFMTSFIFSFLVVRSIETKSERFENIADVFFLAGLSLMFITTLLFSFNIIH
jgi:hypothetical protein